MNISTSSRRRKRLQDLVEIQKERLIGPEGAEISRDIPVVDLADFEARRKTIVEEIWSAATGLGFFQLVGHEIPGSLIDQAFIQSKAYFSLSQNFKQKQAMVRGSNAGWECKEQIRPSTGTADQKESFQITLPRMTGLWPDTEILPDFKNVLLTFERMNWFIAMKVLTCLAERLGFAPSVFTKGHDPLAPDYQSTLRLLHYFPLEVSKSADVKFWRAGAHTDFDCLTILHQRRGQPGLQVCPGKEAYNETIGWTDVPAEDHVLTCNVGDMLMRWSDDRLISNLHRVRMPKTHEDLKDRYSIAFFAQANGKTMLKGPLDKYEPITARNYIQMRIKENFK